MAAVWVAPPRPWIAFLLGVLLALPVASLHTRVMTAFDADSANLVAAVTFVQEHGAGFLIETQTNFLPFLLLPPFIAFGGVAGVMLFSVVSVQFLVGVITFLTWRLSHSVLASIAAGLATLSLPELVRRATLVPMYPTMLGFGLLGIYFAFTATQTTGRRRLLRALLSGLCLNLSIESQAVGQLFVLMPGLVLLVARSERTLSAIIRVYGAFALFYLPRLVVNVMDGGTSSLFSNRVDFWVTDGYLRLIQESFFAYPSRLPFPEYLQAFGAGVLTLTTGMTIVVAVLAVVALILGRGRLRWFGLLSGALVLGAVFGQRVPPFARYLSQIMVLLSLGAGGTIAILARKEKRWRGLASIVVVLLLAGAAVNVVGLGRRARFSEARIVRGPLPLLARIASDGRGVIGARAIYLNLIDARIPTYGSMFLEEQELVTFLTWPSDGEVIEVMRHHGIGWVFINRDRSLETAYHDAWLIPTYGKRARHVDAVAKSPNFCLAKSVRRYVLYELGACAQ